MIPFSSRIHWDLRPNRVWQALESRRRKGLPILDLTESNPTHAGLHYPEQAILAAFQKSEALVYEPQPAGIPSARDAVARRHGVDRDRVLLTASTSEAYCYIFKLLCEPGDEVLVPRPSYPLFEFLASMEAVNVRQYPLHYHGDWSIDLNGLEATITDRTRAIILVNPNNPTGSFVRRGEIERLATYNLPLISDEVFADYTFRADTERVTSLVEIPGITAFCMSGLSKVCGLPQMKLGWIIVGGPQQEEIFARLEFIADTYLSVATPVQLAAPELLQAGADVQRQIQARVRENLATLKSNISAASPCTLLDVQGGWNATLQVPRNRTEEEWMLTLLEQEGVLVQPGYFYDFDSEAYLILSLLTAPSNFAEGVQRLLSRLDSL